MQRLVGRGARATSASLRLRDEKGQLDLQRHGGHSPEGVTIRVLQRILALTAAIFLLGGGELVQDAGQRFGGAIEPVAYQGCLGGDDLDDRAPPAGRVRVPLDQACAVEAGEHTADGGESGPAGTILVQEP